VAVELESGFEEEADFMEETAEAAEVVEEAAQGFLSDESGSDVSDGEESLQGDESEETGKPPLSAVSSIEKDTLALLEWNKVSEQVARVLRHDHGLRPGCRRRPCSRGVTRGERILLQETESALHLPARLNFEGAADISPVLRRLAKRWKPPPDNPSHDDSSKSSRLCSLPDLCAVLSFLDCADSLHRQLGCSEPADTMEQAGEEEDREEQVGGSTKGSCGTRPATRCGVEECRAGERGDPALRNPSSAPSRTRPALSSRR